MNNLNFIFAYLLIEIYVNECRLFQTLSLDVLRTLSIAHIHY